MLLYTAECPLSGAKRKWSEPTVTSGFVTHTGLSRMAVPDRSFDRPTCQRIWIAASEADFKEKAGSALD